MPLLRAPILSCALKTVLIWALRRAQRPKGQLLRLVKFLFAKMLDNQVNSKIPTISAM
jgi:hypothetical protein